MRDDITVYDSRRSRIFLERRPLSCEVPSRRDSVGGGGSSIIFPWSPKADAIQWGGVVAEFFRGLPKLPGPPPLNRPLYDGIVFQDERVFVPASHSGKTRSAPPPNGCWPVRLWLMHIIEDAIIYFQLNDFLPAVHVLFR